MTSILSSLPPVPGQISDPWSPSSVTAETLAKVRHVLDQGLQRAMNISTGLDGYDLAIPAQVVVPQVTPILNGTKRVGGKGNTVHHFKSITSLGWNNTGAAYPGATSEGSTTNQMTLSVAPLYNVFKSITTTQSLTIEAALRDRSLMGDMQAMMISHVIIALKLTEEAWLANGSDYLWNPSTPLAPTTATTGGSIAAGTYYVAVSATNAAGETFATAAPATVITTGTTSTISLTFFTVCNATGYNVYVGTSAGTLYKQVAANFSVPSAALPTQSVLNMAGSTSITLSSLTASGATVPTANSAMTAVDTTPTPHIPSVFNGIMALLFGAGNSVYAAINGAPSSSFTASGTNAASVNLGAGLGLNTMTPHVMQPASAAGTLAYSDLDKMLLWGWMDSRADYDYIACSAQDQGTLTNLLLNNSGTRVILNQADNLGNITANARVTKFVNPYTGKMVDVVLWPMLPQGTLIFGSRVLPYPVQGFDGPVMKVITNRDYWALDFPPVLGNPVYAVQGRVDETLEISFLGGFGAITGIIPS